MIPLSNVVNAQWNVGRRTLTRYNGFAAVEIVGSQAPGHSSGEAMDAMQKIVEKDLPPGFGYDWAGQSHQEILSGSQTTMLMVLSIVVVFLCLAALYESWSVPVSVLLVVPVGVLGAIALSMARGLPNDIYFKIGLITVIGLAAKNAILIVEFAIQERNAGQTARRRGGRSGEAAAAPDPDDVARLHVRFGRGRGRHRRHPRRRPRLRDEDDRRRRADGGDGRVAQGDAVFSPRLAGFVLDAFRAGDRLTSSAELDELTPRGARCSS